jgi:hypothetical protein
MPDLAVLIPTRGRPDNIRKVIAAWDFTNAWDHADMVLVVDADDPEIKGYRQIVEETEHPDTGEPLIKLIEMAVWMPMVHKLNFAAKGLAGNPQYFALGFAGDDHRPQTINWAARYLYVLRELGSGMVYGDDGYQGANLSTEWAVTADVVRAWGRMIPAGVEHMYCDNAILEAFTLAGAVRHLPEIRIEHYHPIVGKSETDEQYKRVNSSEQFRKDRAAFQAWQSQQRDTHVSQIKQLRAGLPMVRQPGKAAKRITRKAVSKVTKAGFPRWFKRVVGATPDDIAVTLADYAIRVPADQEIVELGVFHGRTAIIMAWGAQQGHGAHVTAIDPWELDGNVYDPPFNTDSPRRWAQYHVKGLGYANHISLIQAFSTEVAAGWTGKPIGLLFVDGDHTKQGARDDITTWVPHLAPGAVIAVDDYGHPDWPGVGEAVDELVAEGFLEPIQLFHDRLAVTRLATAGKAEDQDTSGRVTAITSEGVSPSPYPAVGGQVADEVDELFGAVGPETVTRPEPRSSVDIHVSTSPMGSPVQPGELEDVAAGTVLDNLTVDQMKVLARKRGVSLGRDGKTRAIALAKLKGAPQ